MKAKVKMIKDQHRFKQSSCGVQFFASENSRTACSQSFSLIPKILPNFCHIILGGAWEVARLQGVFSPQELHVATFHLVATVSALFQRSSLAFVT